MAGRAVKLKKRLALHLILTKVSPSFVRASHRHRQAREPESDTSDSEKAGHGVRPRLALAGAAAAAVPACWRKASSSSEVVQS